MSIRTEVLDHCESCGRALYEGDMAYSYDDGPTFCWQHSPTWADVNREQLELIEAGVWGDHFDSQEDADAARQAVLKRITSGEGDRRVARPL